MTDPDPERIDLRAPLPGGALSARVVFKTARVGLDRTVKRSVATHADVELEFLGPRTETRRLSRPEVEAYLEEVARLHAEGDRRDAAHRERVAGAREARASLQAAGIDLSCGRCGVPRVFEGRRDLLSAGRPEHLNATGEFIQQMRPSSRAYYEYACPRCGSVEWFRHGPLEHPVEGAGPIFT